MKTTWWNKLKFGQIWQETCAQGNPSRRKIFLFILFFLIFKQNMQGTQLGYT